MKSIKEILNSKSNNNDMKMSNMFGKSNKTFGSLNFGNVFGNKSSNLKGASLSMQNQWSNMTTSQRASMRRRYPDSDGDGVPNRWDCQPNNRMRQDSYYTEKDKSHWEIELGPEDNEGYYRVYLKKYYDEDDEPVGAFNKDEMN